MSTEIPVAVTYRARWVWAEGRWVEGGRVTLQSGQIVGVGTERVAGEVDLGEQLLLPGLVNAHTHLEFSQRPFPLPSEGTFASWIRNVVWWRGGQTDASTRAAIESGLIESARAGVTLLGEIATRCWDAPTALNVADVGQPGSRAQNPQLVVFCEVLGLKPEAISPQMADACRHLIVGATRPPVVATNTERDDDWVPNWTAGLSPHAPYSLSRDLFAHMLNVAIPSRCPVAMHLAETPEELELLASGTGPLAELFTEWGLWTPGQQAAFRTPLEVLQELSVLPRVLVVHGNYLSLDELDFLAGKDNFSVVYCPRTHSYFQHERYPLAAMIKRGIRVALGTDSRASNPDLNLLSEVRHAARMHPEIAPTQLLEMATRDGAEALGMGQRVGRIAPGWRASCCVLPLVAGIRNPEEAVLGTSVTAFPLGVSPQESTSDKRLQSEE